MLMGLLCMGILGFMEWGSESRPSKERISVRRYSSSATKRGSVISTSLIKWNMPICFEKWRGSSGGFCSVTHAPENMVRRDRHVSRDHLKWVREYFSEKTMRYRMWWSTRLSDFREWSVWKRFKVVTGPDGKEQFSVTDRNRVCSDTVGWWCRGPCRQGSFEAWVVVEVLFLSFHKESDHGWG